MCKDPVVRGCEGLKDVTQSKEEQRDRQHARQLHTERHAGQGAATTQLTIFIYFDIGD